MSCAAVFRCCCCRAFVSDDLPLLAGDRRGSGDTRHCRLYPVSTEGLLHLPRQSKEAQSAATLTLAALRSDARSAFNHIYDSAFGCVVPRASFNGPGQHALNLSEIGHLRADLVEVMGGYFAHLVTTSAGRPAEAENAAHLFGTKAKLACSTDKAEGAEMVLTINAMAALGTRWRGDHPHLLEIADRLDVDARAPGKLADCDA